MSSWGVIALVAGREIRVKAASKSFLIATGVLVAVVVVGGFLFNVVGTSDPLKVALTPQTASLAGTVTALSGEEGATTRAVADEAAGRALVKDGDVDALLTGTPTRLEVVVDSDLDPGLRSVFTAIAQQQALASEIKGLGGDPDTVAGSLRDAVPTVTQLDQNTTDAAQVVAAYVVGILIFMALISSGQLVAQGVVEEKTSRVVELLLAAIKPWQLLTGKVLGIGLTGLAQVAVVVVAGVASALSYGLLDASSLNLGATAFSALGWFVVGYATYALLLAGLASLVSRQEDVASVTSPVTFLMAVPYVVAVSIATYDPDNPLVVWMSQLPFCAPFVMPVRIAAGDVPGWQLGLSIGLSLAVIPVLVRLAGRLYSNAVLETGSRVKFLAALRQPQNAN
ncbi:MAG: sodium transporter permease [Marmoricola sp.]|nr:sodium transporter permease [Marmoricola sp.]